MNKKYTSGGLVQVEDEDKVKVLLSRGWWECKECGALFESHTDPPMNHICKSQVNFACKK